MRSRKPTRSSTRSNAAMHGRSARRTRRPSVCRSSITRGSPRRPGAFAIRRCRRRRSPARWNGGIPTCLHRSAGCEACFVRRRQDLGGHARQARRKALESRRTRPAWCDPVIRHGRDAGRCVDRMGCHQGRRATRQERRRSACRRTGRYPARPARPHAGGEAAEEGLRRRLRLGRRPTFGKIREETDEIEAELAANAQEAIADEIGDLHIRRRQSRPSCRRRSGIRRTPDEYANSSAASRSSRKSWRPRAPRQKPPRWPRWMHSGTPPNPGRPLEPDVTHAGESESHADLLGAVGRDADRQSRRTRLGIRGGPAPRNVRKATRGPGRRTGSRSTSNRDPALGQPILDLVEQPRPPPRPSGPRR